jgi:hypothetical protein
MWIQSKSLILFFPIILSINKVDFESSSGVFVTQRNYFPILTHIGVMNLRGGFTSRRTKAKAIIDPREKSRIIKRMKAKLTRIKTRHSRLEDYEKKWILPESEQNQTISNQTNGRNGSHASRTFGNFSVKPKGVESILKELNSTGLCRTEELDMRVHAFMARLKKSGKRPLLSAALAR